MQTLKYVYVSVANGRKTLENMLKRLFMVENMKLTGHKPNITRRCRTHLKRSKSLLNGTLCLLQAKLLQKGDLDSCSEPNMERSRLKSNMSKMHLYTLETFKNVT